MNEYDYDYHDLAENADFVEDDECYYDDGTDEPWVDDSEVILDEKDQYQDYLNKYDSYYHDIADELDD